MGLKERVKESPGKFKWMMNLYNKVLGGNSFKVKGCRLEINCALLKRSRIEAHGLGNSIEIGQLTRMTGTTIFIKGNNNKVIIDDENGFENCSIWIEDDNNEIHIGRHNRFFKNSHLAALEGTKITIGCDGLFAPDVQIRTSDSHSIIDKDSGRRVNAAADVTIGDHVWIATGAVVLKGSVVPSDCVVGINSLVNKKLDEESCVYAGNPAKKVKTGVSWDSKRL